MGWVTTWYESSMGLAVMGPDNGACHFWVFPFLHLLACSITCYGNALCSSFQLLLILGEVRYLHKLPQSACDSYLCLLCGIEASLEHLELLPTAVFFFMCWKNSCPPCPCNLQEALLRNQKRLVPLCPLLCPPGSDDAVVGLSLF